MGDNTETKRLHIAALGSSFAAGPGIPPQINRMAGRSGNNYAHLLAARLDADLTDLTVSGATLNNILSEPQQAYRWSTSFPPQITGLPADADIVTVTGGGNDMGYIGGVSREALKDTWLGYVLSWLMPTPPSDPLTAEAVAKRFTLVVDEIQKITPKARILLVEYFCLLGPDTRPGIDVNLTEEQIKHHQGVAEQVKTAYRLVAEARPGCEVIPVDERSRAHALGSKEPWIEGFSWGTVWQGNPFHPNLKGMQGVADMIYEKLKDDGVVSSA
jgi:lysophospholipase L1-like esterase